CTKTTIRRWGEWTAFAMSRAVILLGGLASPAPPGPTTIPTMAMAKITPEHPRRAGHRFCIARDSIGTGASPRPYFFPAGPVQQRDRANVGDGRRRARAA